MNLSAPTLLRRDAVPGSGIQSSDFRLHRSLLSLVVISLELSQIAFADTTRRLVLFLLFFFFPSQAFYTNIYLCSGSFTATFVSWLHIHKRVPISDFRSQIFRLWCKVSSDDLWVTRLPQERGPSKSRIRKHLSSCGAATKTSTHQTALYYLNTYIKLALPFNILRLHSQLLVWYVVLRGFPCVWSKEVESFLLDHQRHKSQSKLSTTHFNQMILCGGGYLLRYDYQWVENGSMWGHVACIRRAVLVSDQQEALQTTIFSCEQPQRERRRHWRNCVTYSTEVFQKMAV